MMSFVLFFGGLSIVRDVVQDFVNGDNLGAVMNAIDVVRSVADLGGFAKASGIMMTFVEVHPQKSGELLKVLVSIFKYMPDSAIEPLLRIFDSSAVDSIVKNLAGKSGNFGKVLELSRKGIA